MKFRTKVVVCMISILSIIFGAGSSALILNSFNSALDREKKSAIQSYEMILNTLKVVNGVEAWADSKDISNTIKEMSTQRNTSWAGIHIYTEKNELYKDGKMKDARAAGRCPSGVFGFSFQIIFFLILFTYCFEQCRISPISLSEYQASRSLKIRE